MIFTQHFSRYSTALLLTVSLGGCSYLIPPNPSSPRYNTVVGERHAPALNAQSATGAPTETAAVTPPDAPNFPPVDDATRIRAQQEMTAAQPVDAVSSAPLPSPTANGRVVPVENAAPTVTVAENTTYPSLASVPPRPVISGDESDAARLARIRSALEADRASANTARDQLAHDAAQEPSMQPLPEATGTVPPPAPVSVAPVAPPPAATPSPSFTPAPQSSNVPAPNSIAPVPTPVFPPPPPPSNMSALPPAVIPAQSAAIRTPVANATFSTPAVTPVAAVAPAPVFQPMPSAPPAPAVAPIVLRPPTGDVAAANVPAPAFHVTPTQQFMPQPAPPAAGGFDPMADGRVATSATQPSVYASTGYLPDSRYSSRPF